MDLGILVQVSLLFDSTRINPSIKTHAIDDRLLHQSQTFLRFITSQFICDGLIVPG